MAKNTCLGKGLDAIFTDTTAPENEIIPEDSPGIFNLRLSDIEPDKAQPRRNFDPEALSSLADSISRHGILQPLVVRKAVVSESENSPAARILAGKI